jgi:hypothetical protein
MITNPLFARLIPTLDNGANLSRGRAEHECHLIWGVALLQQPQDVPMRSLNGSGRASGAFMEFFTCQFGGHGHSFRHASIIHSLNGFDSISDLAGATGMGRREVP